MNLHRQKGEMVDLDQPTDKGKENIYTKEEIKSICSEVISELLCDIITNENVMASLEPHIQTALENSIENIAETFQLESRAFEVIEETAHNIDLDTIATDIIEHEVPKNCDLESIALNNIEIELSNINFERLAEEEISDRVDDVDIESIATSLVKQEIDSNLDLENIATEELKNIMEKLQ